MSTITIRLNEEEKKAVASFAKMYGMSVSEFARETMFERIEDELDLADLKEAVREWEKEPVTISHEEAWRMIESE